MKLAFMFVLGVVLGLSLVVLVAFGKPAEIRRSSYNVKMNEAFGNRREIKLNLLRKRLEEKLSERQSHSYPSGFTCRTCRIVFNVVRTFWMKKGVSHMVAIQFTISLCGSLGIQHREVCRGIIEEFHNELYYIFRNTRIGSDSMCSALLDRECGGGMALDKPWNVSLPNTPKPPISHVKPYKGGSVIKVLHLTDLHIDLQYKENTSSKCEEPLCCREDNGPGDAGYWGSYGCDIPMRTFESALQHIRDNHKDLSYIILTGDIPPHDVWQDTKKSQIEIMKKALEKIAEYFPDKKVFVAAGNHDTHPANSFPGPSISAEYSIQWLLDSFADMWSVWLPNSSLSTVRKGGYYTVLVSKGFRLVSMNNNYCNKLNWWIMLNNTDPAGELQWLIHVLQHAEDEGEKVHIIAHIPTGDNLCYKYWSWNYYKIINRYESTVAAQFCGHTHQDHFEIFYDLKNIKRPISLWYIAPSLTTSNKYQPGYRIYEIDGDHENTSRVVLDHKTFVLNLEKSNKDLKAFWELEYSAMDAYNMASLLPKDWDELVKKMENDEKLFQKFYKYKYRYPFKEPCDRDCKRLELCAMRTARSHDNTFCNTDADNVLF